ncbi:MAG: hypothetical protein RLZ98_1107 [Pseudomonadota bacterium]|jgi:hypothetical protein
MIHVRYAFGFLIGSASIVLAAIAGVSDAQSDQLFYAVVSLLSATLSLGLVLDNELRTAPRRK